MALEFLDRQKEHWALLREPQGGVGRSLAIFVHGFLRGIAKPCRSKSVMCSTLNKCPKADG